MFYTNKKADYLRNTSLHNLSKCMVVGLSIEFISNEIYLCCTFKKKQRRNTKDINKRWLHCVLYYCTYIGDIIHN